MKRFIGLFLLLTAVAIVVVYAWMKQADDAAVVHVTGLVGSEKTAFLENPQVQDILRREYHLTVDVRKAGSVEMVRHPTVGEDFLWPGGQVNVEMFRESGGVAKKVESIFHSPIVFYSWHIVTDQLIENGVVSQEGESYYVNDPGQLFQMILDGKTWQDLGLAQLFGRIAIKSTDPTKSNSGNMFAALLANTLNKNEIVDEATLPSVMPSLVEVFKRQGYMEDSSGVLFGMFVEQGVGAYPMIVGYENQLVEFSLQNRQALDLIRDKLRIIYPRPTVWASHPLIATTEAGTKLVEALQDEQIQKIAWEQHGFRSGNVGSTNDPSVFAVNGLPTSITSVMPTPNAKVMTSIVEQLSR